MELCKLWFLHHSRWARIYCHPRLFPFKRNNTDSGRDDDSGGGSNGWEDHSNAAVGGFVGGRDGVDGIGDGGGSDSSTVDASNKGQGNGGK